MRRVLLSAAAFAVGYVIGSLIIKAGIAIFWGA